ncbi:MAG: hypothetical protein Ct9H300mP15_19770 [Gemmatimonadota bacterium]|nr:MAG: hypothetical protein Ct9H300mP15_19770 [Gemmatimonadota bacterium]
MYFEQLKRRRRYPISKGSTSCSFPRTFSGMPVQEILHARADLSQESRSASRRARRPISSRACRSVRSEPMAEEVYVRRHVGLAGRSHQIRQILEVPVNH